MALLRPAAALLAVVFIAGCGEAATHSATPQPTTPSSSTAGVTPTDRPTPTPSASSPARTGTIVITGDSEYGRMLYDASGQPIYLFDAETGTTPRCLGACAEDWPPVLTTGLPRARAGVREDLLGTTRRKDGSTQVTYAGHPLYFYAHEGKYQVLCHDVVEYGGTWLVVRPDGRPAPG
jgi:predicted lipoprotein with Yx(FWY)xxD motif